jgi:GT2 family glycosyltransferase
MSKVVVIIPNLNGAAELPTAIDSLLSQSFSDFTLVIVDNGSHDTSRAIIESYCKKDARVRAIWRDKNYGFTGGVNPGLELSIREKAHFAALFNNDAIADKDWLQHLVAFIEQHPAYGIATCKLLHSDGKTIDSTGDIYTVWGIPYPRGRNQTTGNHYDKETNIFGASGGASIYRVAMLEKIGLFDQDFFAYYEDIDISFRAQLSGWKVAYVPKSIAYHEQGTTSGRMKNGFTTMQYMKNTPMVLIKNTPRSLLIHIAPRFFLAYSIFFLKAVVRPKTGWWAIKGFCVMLGLLPKKLTQRRHIQRNRQVTDTYIWSIIDHDLPPNAQKLRHIRSFWWRLTFRTNA